LPAFATIEQNESVQLTGIRPFLQSDHGAPFLLAFFILLLHTVTNGQYGFHRDELLTFDNGRHLSWGYIVYPPITAFLAHAELEIFGNSLRGFRVFAALAQNLTIIFTGLAARELGGKRIAQLLAASAVAISGPCLYAGGSMSYTSLDYFWWILVAYFVIRLLKSEDPRWWLAIGAAIALGLMTKYTMAFLVLGVLGGTLLTPAPPPKKLLAMVRRCLIASHHPSDRSLADSPSLHLARLHQKHPCTRYSKR